MAERFGAENVTQLRELAENRLRTIDRDLTEEEKQTLLAEILLEAGISPRDQPPETASALDDAGSPSASKELVCV